jgi:hypothetical protein
MKRSIAIAFSFGMGALLLGFQNCSNQTGFTSSGELVSKTVDLANDNTDAGPIVDPNPPSTPAPGGSTRNDRDDDHDDDHDHDSGNGNHHHPGAKAPCSNRSHTATNTTTGLNFVCVLRGNGKSERVGLSSGSLAGQVGTPQDVCMSENACLKILASKFEVRSAEPRGFCSNLSAHVVSMTDLEIETALAQAELARTLETKH